MNHQRFDPRRIRWVALDAVGTSIEPSPPAGTVYHSVGTRHGSQLSATEVASRFRNVFARVAEADDLDCGCPQAADRLHTCDRRERLRWQRIVQTVLDDVSKPEECFEELFAHFGQPDSWRCFPEVGSVLARLRKAGFRLAVCSNFDSRLHSVMNGMRELSPIELRVISSEVESRKPSPRFFEALERAAGCSPAEIVFVGDDPVTDVAAAQAAGLCAWQIDRRLARDENQRLHSLTSVAERLIAS